MMAVALGFMTMLVLAVVLWAAALVLIGLDGTLLEFLAGVALFAVVAVPCLAWTYF